MGRFRILIYSCIFLLLSSCCIPIVQKKFYTTEYGSVRPKKNKFSLSKNQSKSNGINVVGVYISDNKNLYYRFFENNKFIVSGFNSNINELEQYNNLKKGRIGYFQVNKGEILLEYFSVGPNDCGEYHQYKIKMIGDSIVGCQKINIEGLNGTPDW